MSDTPAAPFASRRSAYAKGREEADALEKMHLENLLRSESGKWLLSRLVRTFESKVHKKRTGHNSEDSYYNGIQDHAMEYRDLLARHFGHSVFDKLDLKGNS